MAVIAYPSFPREQGQRCQFLLVLCRCTDLIVRCLRQQFRFKGLLLYRASVPFLIDGELEMIRSVAN